MKVLIEHLSDGWCIKIGKSSYYWDHNDPNLGTIQIKNLLEDLGYEVDLEEIS